MHPPPPPPAALFQVFSPDDCKNGSGVEETNVIILHTREKTKEVNKNKREITYASHASLIEEDVLYICISASSLAH